MLGAVNVEPGGRMLTSDATIGGGLRATGPALLAAFTTSIGGNVTAHGLAVSGHLEVCGSRVGGSLVLTNSEASSLSIVGSSPLCSSGNVIGGSVSISGNRGSVILRDNTVGGTLSFLSNGAPGGGAGFAIGGNTVVGVLSCSGNVPAPQLIAPNRAARILGQCRPLGP